MTLNDLEWLFHDKMRFWPALLESERLNVRNSTTSAILRCSVHFTIIMYLYLYSYRRETARQLRMYAQLTRCFSAVAELLVNLHNSFEHVFVSRKTNDNLQPKEGWV